MNTPPPKILSTLLKEGMTKRMNTWPLFLGGGTLFLLAAAYKSLFTVDGGYRAVVFNSFSGTNQQVYDEGMHLIVPFIEKPIFFDIRAYPCNIRSPTGSSDLQMISVSLRILSRPDPSGLPKIYQTLGEDYSDRVLPSIVNEVSKAVVAQYTASELLIKRDQVSHEIKSQLTTRAREFHIIINEVSITDLGFGQEFRAAVEAKQVAQQDAKRAEFLVMKAMQDKQSAIIKANGEAESIRLIGKAVENNPNFIKLRKLEAIRTIATTLAGSKNRVMLDSSNLLLNTLSDEVPVEVVPVQQE